MNFQQLRFVVAVAETRSFTRAADLCCVTQPALSNAIALLEEELGGKLFERSTRSVALTPFGETIIGEMRSIIDAKSRLFANSAEYLSRADLNIRIGMSPLISDDFVKGLLGRIAAQNRNVNAILSEMNMADLQPALDAGDIDVGLGPGPWHDTSLCSAPIYSEPLLYISGRQPEEETAPITVDALSDQQILMVGDDCGLSLAVRAMFKKNQIVMNEYEGKALGYGVLEKWAQLGIGFTLLPASKVIDLKRARRLNNRTGAAVSINFHACWRPSQQQRSGFAPVLNALQAGS